MGLPSTYVYAENLSGEAILAGLRQRRAYVSMGAQVTFQAQANGQTHPIGADLGLFGGGLEFAATVFDSPGAGQAQIVRNGEIVAEASLEGGRATLSYATQGDPTTSAWYRLDVWDENGQILAVTNPIFAGPRLEPEKQIYGAFIP